MLAEGRRPEEGRPTGRAPAHAACARRGALRARGRASTRTSRPIGTPLCVGGLLRRRRARRSPSGSRRWAYAGRRRARHGGGPGAAGAWVDARRRARAGLRARGGPDARRLLGLGAGHLHVGGRQPRPRLRPRVPDARRDAVADERGLRLHDRLEQHGDLVQAGRRPSAPWARSCTTGPRASPASPTARRRWCRSRSRFRNPVTKREETFRFEITPNTIMFQKLLISAVQDAFQRAEATLGPQHEALHDDGEAGGHGPVVATTDVIGGFDGGFQRVLIGLVDRVLNHETQRGAFESVTPRRRGRAHRPPRRRSPSVTPSVDEARPGQTIDARGAARRRASPARSRT